MDNSISITIPPADLQAIKDMLATINGLLEPYLIALTPEDRRKLLKMGDGSEPFVSKVMDYAVSDPQFLPPFVQFAELKKDWDAYSALVPIFRTVQQLENNLSDTVMLTGSEAFEGSLGYYSSIKLGAKMNVPNAKTIYEDLSKRFEAQGKRKTKPSEEI
jgi:hypothetical protein